MRKAISSISTLENIGSYSCMFLCLLSHECRNGVQGIDGEYIPEEDIHRSLSGIYIPSMAGKAKILILNTCRGMKLYPGIIPPQEEVDGVAGIPITSDILTAHATTHEYASFRNTSAGSTYMQTLSKEIELSHPMLLEDVLVSTNRKVANTFQSQLGYKQMPSYTSQLRYSLWIP